MAGLSAGIRNPGGQVISTSRLVPARTTTSYAGRDRPRDAGRDNHDGAAASGRPGLGARPGTRFKFATLLLDGHGDSDLMRFGDSAIRYALGIKAGGRGARLMPAAVLRQASLAGRARRRPGRVGL